MPSTASTATRQRAARDILVQIVARIGNLALGVVVTALVARALGTTLYGEWSTIFVILAIVGYLASFGMENVVIREVAADHELEHEWFGAMMYARIALLAPVMIVSVIALVLLHRSHQMLVAGLILTAATPFYVVDVFALVFQVRVANLVPMIVLTLRSLLWGAAVLIIYLNDGGMVALAVAMAGTNAAASLIQAVLALRTLERWPRPSRAHLRILVRAAVPIGVAGVLVLAYGRIDQLIVYQSSGSHAAGLYGAVYGVLEQAHFVPISIVTTLTPIIAASGLADRARMLRTMALAAELMAIASLGGLAFAAAAAGPVIRLIFGAAFAGAAPALPVLGGAFVLICFGYLNDSLMTVLHVQGKRVRFSLIALAFNLLGNLLLVPSYGFIAAAWMTLATELLVLVLGVRVVWARLELHRPSPGPGLRIVLAAVLLWGALIGLRAIDAGLAVLVPAACVLYPALLFALSALDAEDVRSVLRRASL
jgi:O-antigen/teichoic acid export membrane protein